MQVIGLTDIGNGREINEDDYFFTKAPLGALTNLFLVADGLGGHKAGEIASRMAIESVVGYCREHDEKNGGELMREAFRYANEKVYAYGSQNDNCYQMGTTLVGLTVCHGEYLIANVGDSRAYLYRNGTLTKITKDHSPVQELQSLGAITEEEAFVHKNRNLISRAIGIENELTVDLYTLPAQEEDILLLCTDGLSNFLRRTEMQELFEQEKQLKELAPKLIREALAHGGSDNITLVLVKNEKESEDEIC